MGISFQKRVLLIAAAVYAVSGMAFAVSAERSDALAVHFFDVGQGDAIFIATPTGRQVLIDGGRDTRVIAALGSAMPFFDRHIDMVVATHMDSDHIGGLLYVLRRFNVGMVVVGSESRDTDAAAEFWNIVEERALPVFVVRRGDRFSLDSETELLVLSPTDDPAEDVSDNNTSVVTKLTYRSDTFLFTGDLERQGEYRFMADGIDVSAEVLKVGHHGSGTSSTPWFLQAVSPHLAVIQVGKNTYGHPHEAVLERFSGTLLLRNDENGDITLYSYGDDF
jgi:competence protein ComEC